MLLVVIVTILFQICCACPRDCSRSSLDIYCGRQDIHSPGYSLICTLARDQFDTFLLVQCNKNDNPQSRTIYIRNIRFDGCIVETEKPTQPVPKTASHVDQSGLTNKSSSETDFPFSFLGKVVGALLIITLLVLWVIVVFW